MRKSFLPPLPPIEIMTSDLTGNEDLPRSIRLLVSAGNHHDPSNVFQVGEGRGSRPLFASRILVSDRPFDQIDPEDSRHNRHGQELHVAIEDSKGHLHGFQTCEGVAPFHVLHGVIFSDAENGLWLHALHDHKTMVLEPLDPEPSPLFLELYPEAGQGPLSATTPAAGIFFISPDGKLLYAHKGWKPVDPMLIRDEPGDLLFEGKQKAAIILARRNGLHSLCDDLDLPGRYRTLAEGRSFPLPRFTPNPETPERQVFDDRFSRITFDVLDALRQEGFLEPCRNLGENNLLGLSAWNAWLEGRSPDLCDLSASPAFRMFSNALVDVVLEAHYASKGPLDREAFDRIAEDLARLVRTNIILEVDPSNFDEPQVRAQDGTRIRLAGSLFRPVLAKGMKRFGTPDNLLPETPPRNDMLRMEI